MVGLPYSDHNGSKKELNSLSSAISGLIIASLIEEVWLQRAEIQAFSGRTGFNQYRPCLNPHLDSYCHSKLVLEVAFHGMIGKVVNPPTSSPSSIVEQRLVPPNQSELVHEMIQQNRNWMVALL